MGDLIKNFNKEILIGGFIGGGAISLLELASTIKAGDYQLVSIYFLIGLIASGVIGVIGALILDPKDMKHAISAGIAAPSLLGSLIQSGVSTSVTVVALSLFGTPVYADESIPMDQFRPDTAVVDTVEVDTTSSEDAQQTQQKAEPMKHFLRALGVQ